MQGFCRQCGNPIVTESTFCNTVSQDTEVIVDQPAENIEEIIKDIRAKYKYINDNTSNFTKMS